MRLRLPPALAAVPLAAALACAGPDGAGPAPAGPPGAPPAAARGGGDVTLRVDGAPRWRSTIDGDRIVGARVALTRRGDGSWAGTLDGARVTAAEAGSRLEGQGVGLEVSRGQGWLLARGTVNGKPLELGAGPERIVVQTDLCVLKVTPVPAAAGRWSGLIECLTADGADRTYADAELSLDGPAADLARAPLPALVLALAAIAPLPPPAPPR